MPKQINSILKHLLFFPSYKGKECCKIRLKTIFYIISLFILSGCGYQLNQTANANIEGQPQLFCDSLHQFHTITVPFVEGDKDGTITAAIVREIGLSTRFRYRSEGGSLQLKIKIIDLRDENIGFRYDRKKEGKLTRYIIPAETRMFAIADVWVVESASSKTILGPVRITSEVDFDHDYYSSRNGINVFSLGQLSDFDSAEDAAYRPLSEALAQKIVGYVNNSW
jgi:hypothetical protein